MSDPTPEAFMTPEALYNAVCWLKQDEIDRVVAHDEALRAERDNLALTVEEDAIYLRTAEAALEAETRRTGGIEDELEYVYTVLSDETRRADEAERAKADLVAAYDAQFTAKLRDQMAAARAVLASAPVAQTCPECGGTGEDWTRPEGDGVHCAPCPSCATEGTP